ncbi:MAG TPA: LptF/LptG family permease [Candidatus Angelobacter sp.]|nr:LptF/LptG family permease [Candidatus Angelobacter sp.]
MRLLDRYLLREFLFWLAVFFGAFLLVWIAFDLSFQLHRWQQYHMHGKDVVEYYLFAIPEFVPIALPISLLLAMLYSLTNHTRHNEVTAMRAAGISLWRLCLPYMVAGFFLSVGLWAFNEFYAPQAAERADEVMRRRIEPTVAEQRYLVQPLNFVNYGIGGSGRGWRASVYNTKTFEMTRPEVEWYAMSNSVPVLWLLSADSAVYTNQQWVFLGHVQEKRELPREYPALIAVTNRMVMPGFSETPQEIQSEINVSEYRGISSRTRRADIPLADIVNYLRFNPHPDRKMRDWLFTKLHGRFAGPFACLVVVIVAIPFSARPGRRNIFVGVAASIFLFFAYFFLQQVGLTFGETGLMPPWLGAWFPNLFFGLGGLFLMSRV